MRRGLFRIISGVALLVLQLLSIIGQSSATTNTSPDMWFYIGFYSPSIAGVILLIFGSRAWRNGIYSKLILHDNNKKIHIVMKWCGFALSALLFLCYLLAFIASWREFNVLTILNILGLLSFSVYALFYMYKKPSCLFSAALIFIGVAYIYGICSNIVYYILYLPDEEYFVSYVFTGILPKVVAGILYIIIASIIHKESFSVNVIRILGWTVFALETLSRVVCNIIVLQSSYFLDLLGIMYLLFVNILMMYICVFKVNTLRDASVRVTSREVGYRSNSPNIITPTNITGWQCSCGRIHPTYETSCVCGKSKFDKKLEHPQPNAAAEVTNKIRFCRKCGERLIDESRFCSKCGTQVVEIMASPEETHQYNDL